MLRRVLVIDDDPDVCPLVSAMLESGSYEVHGASGGESGIVSADAEVPDLILLDLQMPGMDGYQVCRLLREGERTSRIPILMLTASDDPALNRTAYAAGAHACILKPFRREALVAVIEAALTRPSRAKASPGE
ncbi:MAG TPA: response regulator [Candidatus Methylomirabilis sp.]|nr:response regulator [Candidatus Methylomirabilis sp.]